MLNPQARFAPSAPSKAWRPLGAQAAYTFNIWPEGGVWSLQGESLEQLVFTSGAEAERQGRRLALCISRLGQDVQLNVYDARNLLMGTIKYFGGEAGSQSRPAEGHTWVH